MTMRWLTIILIESLCAAPVQSYQERKQTMAERIVDIPFDAVIDVQLRTKEKLHGRMGEAKDNSFVVKVATASRIEERRVTFDEVRSIRERQRDHMSTPTKIVIGVLCGFGVLAVIGLIAAAADH